MNKKIAVIGGGFSGLMLTYYLCKKNPKAEIHLFEKSSRVGGIIQTEEKDGFLLEKGPDGFLQQKSTMQDLAQELGIDRQLIGINPQNRKSMILQNGNLIEIPDGFYMMAPTKILPFLQSPLLTWKGKLRTICEIFVDRKKDPSEESLASFVRRRFGSENLEKISQALLGGIYTADPEKLSMQAALPRFVEMEKKYRSVTWGILKSMSKTRNVSGARYGLFGSFRSGMSSLTHAIVAKLPQDSVHINTSAEQVEFNPQTRLWNLKTYKDEQGFDQVCFAIPPYQIAQIFSNLSDHEKSILQSVPYASSAIFHFGFKSSQVTNKPHAAGFVVPQKEKKHFIACSFMNSKYENRAPKGHELLRVFVGGALQQNVLFLPRTELRSKILKELSEILHIEGEPVMEDFVTWPKSMPQYTLGHQDRVAEIKNLFQKYPNSAFVGNGYDGVGLPDLAEHSDQIASQFAL